MTDDPFEQRSAERRDTMNLLDYEVLSPDGETVGRGVARTLNISMTGLLLETGQYFETGQSLRITLGLAKDLVQVTGRVAHSRPVDDDMCTTGVQFVEFPPMESLIFLRYFEKLGHSLSA